MSREQMLNDNDRGKPKYSEKNQPQCCFLHHKSHTKRPGIEQDSPGKRPAANL
jgi:hypothetical protein